MSRYSGSPNEYKGYVNYFQKKGDPIEVYVATHPHSDHIANTEWLLSNYPVSLYIDNGQTHTSQTYKNLETVISDNNINRKQLTDDELPNIDFCTRMDVNAQLLRPEGFDKSGLGINNYSVVLRIDYGNQSFLFTGDAEEKLEELLIQDAKTKDLLDVNFLKVGHHGSNTSSTSEFLEHVTPNIAAISCGAETIGTNKRNKHPKRVTLNNLFPYTDDRPGMSTTLEAYDKSEEKWTQITTREAIYVTNNSDDLVFFSDGTSIWKLGDYKP